MKTYKLTDFDAVLAISRRGSFRAAALDLGMSTSALSNAIAKLEGQLGVRLFNRTTRSVSLTEAGHRFVDQVSPAEQQLVAAHAWARGVAAWARGVAAWGGGVAAAAQRWSRGACRVVRRARGRAGRVGAASGTRRAP